MTTPVVRITVNGRLALTTRLAALRYGIAESSMRSRLTRLKGKIEPVAYLDGDRAGGQRRQGLYLATELDKVMAPRRPVTKRGDTGEHR